MGSTELEYDQQIAAAQKEAAENQKAADLYQKEVNKLVAIKYLYGVAKELHNRRGYSLLRGRVDGAMPVIRRVPKPSDISSGNLVEENQQLSIQLLNAFRAQDLLVPHIEIDHQPARREEIRPGCGGRIFGARRIIRDHPEEYSIAIVDPNRPGGYTEEGLVFQGSKVKYYSITSPATSPGDQTGSSTERRIRTERTATINDIANIGATLLENMNPKSKIASNDPPSRP